MNHRPAEEASWSRRFAGTGHRLTAQRRVIMRHLAGIRRYFTAQELHARLARSHPRMGLATVYRTLEMLRELDLVASTPRGAGEAAYLYCAGDHHHHAVCTRCGRVDDVPCRSLPGFERMLSSSYQFRLTEHQLEFYGVCARCS
ncbi:MAG: transcriptional repressor [Candidatus Eremiobacteraeota bacterium]|nr:transcriptional repressor [Candidatus Eremiobacteraeota bacterium]